MDSRKVWLCDYDQEKKQYLWTPQQSFIDKLAAETESVLNLAQAQSFAFSRNNVLYWGWFYPMKGTVLGNLDAEAISLHIKSAQQDKITSAQFYNAFTLLDRGRFVPLFDTESDNGISLEAMSDGTKGSFKINFGGETLFELADIDFVKDN